MKKTVAILSLMTLITSISFAQPFTHADTLRGSNGPARDWWNVTKYDLHVNFNLKDSSISGYNTISFTTLKKGGMMQIDLQEPMVIDSIQLYGQNEGNMISHTFFGVDIKKDGNSYFLNLTILKPGLQVYNSDNFLNIYFHGKPPIARNAPWDGGLVWAKDKNKNPWISIACQGLGASVWYPCKDYQGDEPDSAEIHVTAPTELVSVANGRLRNSQNNKDGTSTYSWAVVSPINNYNLIPYIGKYVNFNEVYKGEKGDLTMNYWVLDYNVGRAKKQFTDATRTMKAFEHWFGPYPFYADGYKLVDAPYLGMEHQSDIAYGNGYSNGYFGRGDLSGTGWGMKWDFIIVHESAHEWFGNNITTKDIADMWVHEAFANYSETLFTEYYYGKQAGDQYIQGLRDKIENDVPVIGSYGVNKEGSTDMYYKGGNMLHTIRQVINNDEKFRMILRGMNKTFYHQTVTTKQIEQYINKESGIDFSKVFDQYLRTVKVPTLEYKINGYKFSYRWTTCIRGFALPLKINFKGERWIKPTEKWQTLNLYPEGDNKFSVDKNFYILTRKVN